MKIESRPGPGYLHEALRYLQAVQGMVFGAPGQIVSAFDAHCKRRSKIQPLFEVVGAEKAGVKTSQ